MFKFNKSSGQVSKLLLVLAVIILVAVIIVYLFMRLAEKPPAPAAPSVPVVPQPVYEKTLGNIRFVFESALDRGSTLRAVDAINNQYASSTQKDLMVDNTGAKFLIVTIGAQNMGTVNIEQNSWGLENVVDDKGRNFVPLEGYAVNPWLPNPNLCGALLNPAFDPTPCVKIYEVSKNSVGFKIRIETGKDNTSQNYTSGKKDSDFIDLIVK